MTLCDAINQFIVWRQAHGTKFEPQADILKLFLECLDRDVGCDTVTRAQVRAFLAGQGPLTRYRAMKYSVLSGFYRYAISRGYVTHSPLPARETEPKAPASAPPYVYTDDELRCLFSKIDVARKRAHKLDAHTFRMLLLLLYGAGLRRGEAMRFTVADVNLSDAVLTVRDSKFYKNRIVPVGPSLAGALREYAVQRTERAAPEGRNSTFLANQDGTPLAKRTVQDAFAGLLRCAGIHGTDDSRLSPRLHSLRHTFAVKRLTSWYQQGADVQRLLPVLSTYLGHKDLTGTQVYLSMTPELLQQASQRFERYARGGDDE